MLACGCSLVLSGATVRRLPAGGSSSRLFIASVWRSRRYRHVWGAFVLFERREGEPLNLKALWSAALGEIQVGLSKGNYETWFKDTAIVSEEDDVFMVGVPNAFAREWLDNKYRNQIRETPTRLPSRPADLRL